MAINGNQCNGQYQTLSACNQWQSMAINVTDNIKLPYARCQSGFVRELLHLLQARILPRRLDPFRRMPKFGWGVGHELFEPLVVGAQHGQQDRSELLEAREGRLRQAQHLARTGGPCSV